ncbi:putative dolichol-P-glucose synthetase [Mariniradius saccharolyticus AK6]|uniref:Dolichol-P-glucose synthetase n=1 Tax=Mariniradius saccharolyticus AK6 TaxID=1239962 RepID=M7X3K2_9BACT|nr:lysylphosphatidylglycerol synthase transmembrane domain-containing protein [Mariniradius saccharolyticus]EMS32065.1 putative dolichol-P-glucose synthetase [Mariniradius saccharolyticus AK6]
MRFNTKQWIQVGVSLVLAAWIFWFLYKDVSIQRLGEALEETSYSWLLLSLMVGVYGYWVRAWRWKLLIEADGSAQVSTGRSFVALMIGYLTNLLIPRAGEVSRCGVLSKSEEIPMGRLLGTVVLERSVDLILMIMTVLVAFFWERNTFLDLVADLVNVDMVSKNLGTILPIGIAGVLVAILFFYLLFYKYRENITVRKIRHFFRDFITGILSVRKVDNQWGFWGSSVGLWLLYYLMMVLVAWAIPSTASLAYSSILMVMVMGSIGMIAPVQGGIGTFHALVAFILMVYGLEEEEGKIFAVIIHSSQLIVIVLLGLITMAYFIKITSKKVSKSS